LKKAAQKLLWRWAEGLKVLAVRSTVGIAPEGMGIVGDSAHGKHKIKVFLLLFVHKKKPFLCLPVLKHYRPGCGFSL
jgi:hypothetical protein